MRRHFFVLMVILILTTSEATAKIGISLGGGGGYPLSSFGDNTLLRINDTSGVMVDYKNGPGYFFGADVLFTSLELGYRYNNFGFSKVERSPSKKVVTLPNAQDPSDPEIDAAIKAESDKVDGKSLSLQTIDGGIRIYLLELFVHPYVDAGAGLAIISALDEKSYGGHIYAGGGIDFKIAPFLFIGVQARYNIAIMQKKTSLEEAAAKIAEGANFEVKDFASYMNYISGNLMLTLAF